MTSSVKFLTTSIISYITGILALSGHLPSSDANSLSIGFQDIVGGVLIVAPILYNLEHHSKTPTNTTTVAATQPVTTVTTEQQATPLAGE